MKSKFEYNPSPLSEQPPPVKAKPVKPIINTTPSPLASERLNPIDVTSHQIRQKEDKQKDVKRTSPTKSKPDEDNHFNVPPEFLNRLATFPLFNKAPKSFHSKIASKLTLMQYHPQEYIIKKGDPSKSMYWIMKGTVTVTSTDGESIYAELFSEKLVFSSTDQELPL